MSSFIEGSGCSARPPSDAVGGARRQGDKNGEMETLFTTIDSAFNQRFDSAKGYVDCFTNESGVTELLVQQAEACCYRCELDACGARPKVKMPPLTPRSFENVCCCWSLERRRQATYRVLYGWPLLLSTPATKASVSPRRAPLLAQQFIEEAKPRRTPRPRKRRSPKARRPTANSSKRRSTAVQRDTDSQVSTKSELHAAKMEDKLSLIDQILFGDPEDSLATTPADTDFTKAEWRVLGSGLKIEEDSDPFSPHTSSSHTSNSSSLGQMSAELLIEQFQLESDKSDQINYHIWSSTGPDFLKSLDEMGEAGEGEEAPVESSSPLDSSLLDDLLGTSDCNEPSLDFEL